MFKMLNKLQLSIIVIFLIPVVIAAVLFYIDMTSTIHDDMEHHVLTMYYTTFTFLLFLTMYTYYIYNKTKKLFNKVINHLMQLLYTKNYKTIGNSTIMEINLLLLYIDKISLLIYKKQLELEQQNEELLHLKQQNEELLKLLTESSRLSIQSLETLIQTRKVKNGSYH